MHIHAQETCLQPRKNNDLVHNNPISHEVQESYRGALQLAFCDDAFADRIHEAEVPVDGVDAPESQKCNHVKGMQATQTVAHKPATKRRSPDVHPGST